MVENEFIRLQVLWSIQPHTIFAPISFNFTICLLFFLFPRLKNMNRKMNRADGNFANMSLAPHELAQGGTRRKRVSWAGHGDRIVREKVHITSFNFYESPFFLPEL